MSQFIAEEQFEFYKPKQDYVLYRYWHSDGSFFSCIQLSLEACRNERNNWIRESYLIENNHIVYSIKTRERFLVFNTNLKGYIVLINLQSARVLRVSRSYFFHQFTLTLDLPIPEKMNESKAYELMLQAFTYIYKLLRKKQQTP